MVPGHYGPLIALRVGELRALRWGGVDLKARLLGVLETVYDGHFDKPRTKRGMRTIAAGAFGTGDYARDLFAHDTGSTTSRS